MADMNIKIVKAIYESFSLVLGKYYEIIDVDNDNDHFTVLTKFGPRSLYKWKFELVNTDNIDRRTCKYIMKNLEKKPSS